MADKTIPNLDAVVTPAATDVFGVRQSGDAEDKKMTRAQIHTLVADEQFLAPVDAINDPGHSWAHDPDTGMYSTAANKIGFALGGVNKFNMANTLFTTSSSNTCAIQQVNVTDTVPGYCPRAIDLDTGVGGDGADGLTLIAGAQNCIGIKETGGAPEIGFYGVTPIALQTGVAVSAAGVHAALVALNLITA